MAVIANPKHERFALEVAEGVPASVAALVAGISFEPLRRSPGDYYVYALIDPIADEVFYIGKGKRLRFAAHLRALRAAKVDNAAKMRRLDAIVLAGRIPFAISLAEGQTESEAFSIERSVISLIGLRKLTNAAKGVRGSLERISFEADLKLRQIRPYCQWVHTMKREPREEHMYWGVIAAFSELKAKKPLGKSPSIHFDLWKTDA